MYAIECIVCQNNREADQSRLAKVERGERGEIGCTCRKKGRTPKVKPVRLSEVTGPYSLEPLKSINDFGYNPKERLSEVRV